MTTELWTVEKLAARYGVSTSWVRERTRVGKPGKYGLLPHKVLPHSRRVLFVPEWIEAFEQGLTTLERIDLPGNGRILRPVSGGQP